jgi:hypothetical protein
VEYLLLLHHPHLAQFHRHLVQQLLVIFFWCLFFTYWFFKNIVF